MASAPWKMSLTFSLVSVPVKATRATDGPKTMFHYVHDADAGRVGSSSFCKLCGKTLDRSEIVRGRERPDGHDCIIITDEDLATLPTAGSEIRVEHFAPLSQFGRIEMETTYYLDTQPNGLRAYTLIRDALRKTKKAGVCKYSSGGREQLALLWVSGDLLAMTVMAWPEEVRPPAGLALTDPVKSRPQEVAMAVSLIETMTRDFDPTEHRDVYEEQLVKLTAAKAAGTPLVASETKAAGTAPAAPDMTQILTASLAEQRKSKAPARTKRAAAGR